MKLLLETVTYIAIKERITCIIAMETVMYIMHCRKYHLHNCNKDSHLHNYNKKLSFTYLQQKVLAAYVLQKLLKLHNCNRNKPLWTHMGHKGFGKKEWKNFYKVLYHCFKTFEMNLMPILFYYISQVIAQ